MSNMRRKIDLYILSLGLLFVFFLIISIQFPECPFQYQNIEAWKKLAKSNVLPIASIVLLFYCFYAYSKFNFDLEGATDIPFEIQRIEDINYEHLTFLATYVVPLISFDFNNERQMIVLGLLLVVMGIIYVKTNLFYANPSLALLGFYIYKADGHFKNGNNENLILISRHKLVMQQKVSYIRLDNNIYYVKAERL